MPIVKLRDSAGREGSDDQSDSELDELTGPQKGLVKMLRV